MELNRERRAGSILIQIQSISDTALLFDLPRKPSGPLYVSEKSVLGFDLAPWYGPCWLFSLNIRVPFCSSVPFNLLRRYIHEGDQLLLLGE